MRTPFQGKNTTPFHGMFQDLQSAWERVQWEQTAAPSWTAHDHQTVVIAGLSGSGKRTLFNSLWGWNAVSERLKTETDDQNDNHSADFGTPHNTHDLGLFTLLNLPQDGANHGTGYADPLLMLDNAAAVIYLIDAQAGLHDADFQWIAQLRTQRSPLVVAVNKIDLCADADATIARLEQQLKMAVVPVTACHADNVQGQFLPRLLELIPALTETLAPQMAELRHPTAFRLVREGMSASLMASLGPNMLLESSALTDVQIRMTTRIRVLYSTAAGIARTGSGSRTELSTWQSGLIIAFGTCQRYLAQRFSTCFPRMGWSAAGVIGVAGTWLIGHAAILYFSADGLTPTTLHRSFLNAFSVRIFKPIFGLIFTRIMRRDRA